MDIIPIVQFQFNYIRHIGKRKINRTELILVDQVTEDNLRMHINRPNSLSWYAMLVYVWWDWIPRNSVWNFGCLFVCPGQPKHALDNLKSRSLLKQCSSCPADNQKICNKKLFFQHVTAEQFFISWLHSLHLIGHKKLLQIVAALMMEQPRTWWTLDNQKIQPGCP